MILSLNASHLSVAQQLSQYSFEIPQNPDLIRTCYSPDATIITNGKTNTLDEFLACLVESNTLNVVQIDYLTTYYKSTDNPDELRWIVKTVQRRLGKGLNEGIAGLYFIQQDAILTFSNGKIIKQENKISKEQISH